MWHNQHIAPHTTLGEDEALAETMACLRTGLEDETVRISKAALFDVEARSSATGLETRGRAARNWAMMHRMQSITFK